MAQASKYGIERHASGAYLSVSKNGVASLVPVGLDTTLTNLKLLASALGIKGISALKSADSPIIVWKIKMDPQFQALIKPLEEKKETPPKPSKPSKTSKQPKVSKVVADDSEKHETPPLFSTQGNLPTDVSALVSSYIPKIDREDLLSHISTTAADDIRSRIERMNPNDSTAARAAHWSIPAATGAAAEYRRNHELYESRSSE
jgi:hypothetical protein